MTLYDVPSDKLVVPQITYTDFQKALSKAHSSVGSDELQRFVSWTEEFGQEGRRNTRTWAWSILTAAKSS